ncbi:hypothetical protein EGW08_003074 [Elysia chlorotica]|uniref:C3H1-type domain-containing protein n=1 Tax=Elysia chlorotica TaxID=188477 RepID=A0A3S1BUQ0_ELYCH|nr:hypothetical protein EGW08_003074 [Elysia chlorotica]
MIIEQVEALKTWLTAKLSPICDAEPGALAKYVCALVKKDKPEQDLRDICVDQLDVFLQQNTKPFVNDLFEALKSKVYVPATSDVKPKPSIATSVKQETTRALSSRDRDESLKKKTSEISSTTDDKENKGDPSGLTSSTTATSPNSKSGSGNTDSVYPKDTKESNSTRDPPREVRESGASSREGRERERGASRDRDRRDSWRDERSRDGIRDARDIIREREKDRGGADAKDGRGDTRESKGDTREVREPRERNDFRERDREFRRRRTRSRSFSPRRRDFDDRPVRRRFEERARYSPDRRWGRRRSWSRSPRRNRSPLDSRGGGRLRSRSPRARSSRSPRGRTSRSPIRYRPLRSRTRSRSPRPRSWSRPGSGGGARLRSRSLSLTRQPDSRGSTPLQDNDFISSSTNDPPAVSSTVGGLRALEGRLGEITRAPGGVDGGSAMASGAGLGGARARCQNFEEKGFCMLGDVCPYDHGADPVVVEDDTLALGPGAPGLEGPDLCLPPPGHLGMHMNLSRPPPAHVEPYLPENPSLQVSLRPPFIRGPPPDLRQPPPGMGMNRLPGPPDMFLQKREVIMNRPPPGLNDRVRHPSDSEPSRIVIPSKRPYSAIDGNPNAMNIGPPPPRMAHINQHHQLFGPPGGFPIPRQQLPLDQQQPLPVGIGQLQMQPGPIRKGFDYNRLGGRGFKHQGPNKSMKFGNMTLEVRKIPHEMNNIAKLNEHFGKFGTLTNIQVKFQGDPGAALISFSSNAQAAAAYRSPEPVFNNRFIKLFWHNAEKPLSLDGERETPIGGPVEDEVSAGQQQQTQRTLTGGRIGDGIDHPSLVLPVRSSIPPAHKMSLDNTKKKETEQAGGDASGIANLEKVSLRKSVIYTSSAGNVKKTIHQAANATTAIKPKAAPFVSPTAVKTADYVSRMEAIKRIEEERKLAPAKQAEIEQKKQELLAKQIEQQKKLLETLEKKKDIMSDAEKQMLRTALRKISDAIDTVKYGTGAKKSVSINPQQFRYVSSQEQVRFSTHPASPYGRGGQSWSTGGRGGYGWAPRGRGRGWAGAAAFGGRTTLDNRPKTVKVKGFDLPELDEIRAHFQKFGDMEKEDLLEEVPSVYFTFTLRQSAEMAVAQGARYKKKTLIVQWDQMIPKISRTESTQSSEVDDDLSITLGSVDSETALLDDKGDAALSVSTSEDNQLKSNDGVDTRSVDNTSLQEAPLEMQTVGYERSLSEDLLAGEEENFKAIYTDDEDDEDHITVTLSNTSTSAPTIYTSSGDYGNVDSNYDNKNGGTGISQDGGEEDEDDLSNLDPGPALDFIEEEPQV